MNNHSTQLHDPRSGLVAAATLMLLAATTAFGQTIPFDQASATVPGPTTRIDAYGNAAPVAPDRRMVGAMLGVGPWLQAPTGYQLLTKALDRRPLRTEPVITKLREVLMGPDAAKKTRAQSPAARGLGRAFSRYGGFEHRAAQFTPMDIRSVLARRYELIQATSRNAPIRRVTWRAGGDVSAVAVRFGAAGSFLMPVVGTGEPTLRQQLQLAAEESHKRVLASAWDQFQSSNYRQAASGFSSAMMLDAKDLEPRIGELMSLLSNGTTRTAAAAVGELARRFDDPFALDLDISSRYGSAVDAVRLRTRAKLVVHADEVNASIAAAYTLALWYLGERHEAIRAADRLEQLHRQSVFGDWAGILRASTTEQGREQPAS